MVKRKPIKRKSNPTNSKINLAKLKKIASLADKYKFDMEFDSGGQVILYTGVYDHEHYGYDPAA